MSAGPEPRPAARPANRPFKALRAVPLRPRGVPAPPPEGDRPSADPVPEGAPGFATSSLELASYLVLTGHRIVRITGPRARRRIQFERVSPEARLDYYSAAPAPARQLFEVWHSLRHGLMNLLD